jgi:hypothetical protein
MAAMAAGRSSSRARFSELIDSLPDETDGPVRVEWLSNVDKSLTALLAELGQEAGSDARGCLFLHAARLEWRASVDTTKVSQEFWAYLTTLAETVSREVEE